MNFNRIEAAEVKLWDFSAYFWNAPRMCSVVRKPTFYICKINAQISCTVTEQRLCFRYIKRTIPLLHKSRERGGSVVEYGLWSERMGGSKPPSASCILEQDNFLPESTGNTKKVKALSRHD